MADSTRQQSRAAREWILADVRLDRRLSPLDGRAAAAGRDVPAAISKPGPQAAAIDGTAGNDDLVGTPEDDELNGLGGDDRLFGLGGTDRTDGGSGNDTHYVERAGDIVIEAVGGGYDIVVTNTSYTLPEGQEIELLRTYGSATTEPVLLIGNEFIQVLAGTGGDDILDGGGNRDTMWGYGGDDTFHVDDSRDGVVEAPGGGDDEVVTQVSYTLAAGVEIEALRATDSGVVLNLTGNEFDNIIVGNEGRNIIDGRGGADTMAGHGGNDDYYVDSSSDVVDERAGGGSRDEIITSVSFTLPRFGEIEVLSTADLASTDPLNLTGNDMANTIHGNAGANRIDGRGGADDMDGGPGDDIYFVDNPGDRMFEGVGEGYDQVIAASNYALPIGQRIELLRTYGSASTNPINLTGNDFPQTIAGNAADNVLDGKGGNDSLWGYGGADTFAFTSALVLGADRIRDFEPGVDTIALDDARFTGLIPGPLPPGAFNTGSTAQDADDRILYDPATGALWFDRDGTGGIGAVQFAILDPGLAVSASDFVVI